MNKVLGVTNPPSDYSMGHLITDTCPRNWHIVGDNLNYAFIVEIILFWKNTLPDI